MRALSVGFSAVRRLPAQHRRIAPRRMFWVVPMAIALIFALPASARTIESDQVAGELTQTASQREIGGVRLRQEIGYFRQFSQILSDEQRERRLEQIRKERQACCDRPESGKAGRAAGGADANAKEAARKRDRLAEEQRYEALAKQRRKDDAIQQQRLQARREEERRLAEIRRIRREEEENYFCCMRPVPGRQERAEHDRRSKQLK